MTEEEERIEMELRRQDRQKARQEEWEKIKGLGWKARAGYLWDYYKFVLVILVFVIVGISIVRTMIIGSMTDMILEVAVLECSGECPLSGRYDGRYETHGFCGRRRTGCMPGSGEYHDLSPEKGDVPAMGRSAD